MYYWDYYAPHWTKDEVENIRGIIQNCRKWFSPKLGDWFSDDYLNGVVSCPENYINKDYYKKLVDDAADTISKYGDVGSFCD